MEVTRKNFKEVLPLVSESIKKSDFLVIDTEFTGLINGRDVSVFDSPKEYYNTLYQGSTDFLLIQFGLCAFYWDENGKHYMNDAYNFYLFPRGKPGPDKMFLCQSSSIDFLASQGFDFNKLIKEGISYMTEPIETRLRENLTEKQKSYSIEKDTILIPDEHKAQIEEICLKIREFVDKSKSQEMLIDRCNAFIRRLLFQELKSRFKDEIYVETKVLENSNRVLKVTRVSSENDLKSKSEERKEKEWEDFEEAIGFSKVARMISQSEKLVIGHNMLLDVLHTLNHFFQPLPPDYHSFKEFAHCMFPRLIDTKYMSSLPPFKDRVNSSVLTHLLATLSEPPFSLPKVDSLVGRGYKQTEDKHHEAGYDAFVTGLCFLSMFEHLASMRGEHARLTCSESPALRPFLNKLYLAKTAHHDSPYMHLGGVEPSLSRDHIFYLIFPKEWQRNDINQLFSPYGPVTVQFLDDISALVGLSRKDNAKEVFAALGNNKRFSLLPYNKYHKMRFESPNRELSSKSWHRQTSETTYTSPKPTTNKVTNAVKTGSMVQVKSLVKDVANAVTSSQPTSGRKRTSSGIFEISDTESASKRNSKESNRCEALANGCGDIKRQKTSVQPAQRPCQLQIEGDLMLQTDITSTNEANNKQTTNHTQESQKQDKIKLKEIFPPSNIFKAFQSDKNNTGLANAFKESDVWD